MPSKTEVAKVKDLSPAIIDLERLIARMNEIHEAIGRRAYELFEARGREHGHDLEDWLDAERELVQFFPVVLTDSRESLIVRSEVPGFTGDEIEVGVEPERVFISGRRETQAPSREGALSKKSAQVFRAVDLPVRVEPERATAKLKDGVLEITLPKMPPEGETKKL
jgi:HSP20 family molecular chaperone IbpA